MVMAPPMESALEVVKCILIAKLLSLLDCLSASRITIDTANISPPIAGDTIGRLFKSMLLALGCHFHPARSATQVLGQWYLVQNIHLWVAILSLTAMLIFIF
jgi:hypothetical protein